MKSARSLLSNRGIPFAERNAEANPTDAEALRKLVGELRVPVLVIGENTLKGYEESTWQSALDTAGYPRTRLPNQPTARPLPPPTTTTRPEATRSPGGAAETGTR